MSVKPILNLKYAEKRINLLKNEMGGIKKVFQSDDNLYIEFEDGRNLQIHDDEINHQAIEYLESEIEQFT